MEAGILQYSQKELNPFLSKATFLDPMKTSENFMRTWLPIVIRAFLKVINILMWLLQVAD